MIDLSQAPTTVVVAGSPVLGGRELAGRLAGGADAAVPQRRRRRPRARLDIWRHQLRGQRRQRHAQRGQLDRRPTVCSFSNSTVGFHN